mgnify:CR=1 FL=1
MTDSQVWCGIVELCGLNLKFVCGDFFILSPTDICLLCDLFREPNMTTQTNKAVNEYVQSNSYIPVYYKGYSVSVSVSLQYVLIMMVL